MTNQILVDIIRTLQVSSGLVWLLFLVLLMPAFTRVIFDRGDRLDAFRVPLVFLAIDQVWFIVRWLIWPHAIVTMSYNELQGWTAAYIGSLVSAVTIIGTNYYTARKS